MSTQDTPVVEAMLQCCFKKPGQHDRSHMGSTFAQANLQGPAKGDTTNPYDKKGKLWRMLRLLHPTISASNSAIEEQYDID